MHITDFADGTAWAIAPQAMDRILPEAGKLTAAAMTPEARVQIAADDQYEPVLQVTNGVAVIPVTGTIVPRRSLFSWLFGGAALNRIRADIDAALSDPRVDALLLSIDSPGGQVSGVGELAHYVRAVSDKKPVVAYSDGQMTSGATWIGSATNWKIVSPTAHDGSIGVLVVHRDESKLNEEIGITYTWLTAGKYKALGNPDEPLSGEARAMIEDRISRVYDVFVTDIARFRGAKPKTVREDMAEGRIFIGSQAVDAGLADDTGSMDDALAYAQYLARTRDGRSSGRSRYGASAGATNQSTKKEPNDMWKLEQIKTVDDLKAALPDLAGELERQAAETAKAAVDVDAARTEAAQAESTRILDLVKAHFGEDAGGKLADIAAKGFTAQQYQAFAGLIGGGKSGGEGSEGASGGASDGASGGEAADSDFKNRMLAGIENTGAPDVGAGGGGGGSGPASFTEAVDLIAKEKGCTRSKAMKAASIQYPELYKAYVDGANQAKPAR